MKIGDTVRTQYGLGTIHSKGHNIKFQRDYYWVEFEHKDLTKINKKKELVKFWEYEIKPHKGANK